MSFSWVVGGLHCSEEARFSLCICVSSSIKQLSTGNGIPPMWNFHSSILTLRRHFKSTHKSKFTVRFHAMFEFFDAVPFDIAY